MKNALSLTCFLLVFWAPDSFAATPAPKGLRCREAGHLIGPNKLDDGTKAGVVFNKYEYRELRIVQDLENPGLYRLHLYHNLSHITDSKSAAGEPLRDQMDWIDDRDRSPPLECTFGEQFLVFCRAARGGVSSADLPVAKVQSEVAATVKFVEPNADFSGPASGDRKPEMKSVHLIQFLFAASPDENGDENKLHSFIAAKFTKPFAKAFAAESCERL